MQMVCAAGLVHFKRVNADPPGSMAVREPEAHLHMLQCRDPTYVRVTWGSAGVAEWTAALGST